MCERCEEIDAQVVYYERQRFQSVDKVFLAGLDEVLRIYRAEKAALHPDTVVDLELNSPGLQPLE
jgi:hypothetical protein